MGNYNNHECEIEVIGLNEMDLGEWTCEMESYVYGVGRGTTVKKGINVHVVNDIIVEEYDYGKIFILFTGNVHF